MGAARQAKMSRSVPNAKNPVGADRGLQQISWSFRSCEGQSFEAAVAQPALASR
jgi:hypothetical protein